LNLFYVVGRRADGYHDPQTLFQLIDLRHGRPEPRADGIERRGHGGRGAGGGLAVRNGCSGT
jgi:hypothetical protein